MASKTTSSSAPTPGDDNDETRRSKSALAPTPADDAATKPWAPPTSDQEFEFKSVADAPGWIDKNWAGFDRGPALAVPAGDLFGSGPYHTKFAHVGDIVRFVAARGSMPARFEVIAREPGPEDSTKKPPQASQASLEDMLKNGMLQPDDLGPDAKAQVAARSPQLAPLLEEGAPQLAEPQAVSDVVKLD